MRLEYGPQPLCNRYPATVTDIQPHYPLTLCQDPATGLVRIENPIPAETMRPRIPWLSETEPSSHLDEIADSLAAFLKGDTSARILALSYRDRPLAEKLRARGFANQIELPKDRLGLIDPLAKVESIQAALSDSNVSKALIAEFGNADLILAVRILHHAHDHQAFLTGVRSFLAPSGGIVFELPDCRNHLVSHDHTMLFEEHTLYFTPLTAETVLRAEGFAIHAQTIHPMAIEDALSIIAVPGPRCTAAVELVAGEIALFEKFAAGFAQARKQIRDYIAQSFGAVAIFGAGHHGICFVNLYGLHDLVVAFIDDNPHKLAVRAPGAALPIWPSIRLAEDRIGHCLLAVSQEHEQKVLKVVARKSPDTVCHSIFVESPLALPLYHLAAWPGSPRSIATGYPNA